jgi:thioredoxin-related protein
MLRKILFLSLISTLAIGISSYTYINSQPKPAKKSAKKSSKSKKAASGETSTESANKITWYNMTEGYAKAKKEKKVLIVDVYTDWCYWCKVMDRQTYENKAIVNKMKEYAVAVKFNPEVNGNHTVNGQTLSSDQLGIYLNKGSRIPGYPNTFMWKDLTNSSKIESYSGYLDTTVFNIYLNKMIQQ